MADDFLAKYAGRSFAELVQNEEDGNGNDSIESFSETLMADIAEPSPSEAGDEVEDEGKQEQGEDDCHESSGIYVEAEVKVEISPVEPPRVVPTAAEKIVETKIANQWPEATALRALQAAVSSHSLNDLMQKKRQEFAELQQLQALSVKQEQQAERSSGSSGSAAVPAAGSHDDRPISRPSGFNYGPSRAAAAGEASTRVFANGHLTSQMVTFSSGICHCFNFCNVSCTCLGLVCLRLHVTVFFGDLTLFRCTSEVILSRSPNGTEAASGSGNVPMDTSASEEVRSLAYLTILYVWIS